jgi:putative solute:sodium symporter small subunit
MKPGLHPSQHWRVNRRLTLCLLVVWFVVTFGVAYFARELDFRFFGWPFSFWVAAQGALLVYGLIIAFYAWYMNRLDDQLAEQPEDQDA